MIQPAPAEPTSLTRDSRGAVYVEFLIAFLPVFLFFLASWQLGRFYTTRLVVQHAAMSGARAAAVIIAEPEADGSVAHTLSDAKRRSISSAVWIALAPASLQGWVAGVDLRFPSSATASDDRTAFTPAEGTPTMVHLELHAAFACDLPPVDLFLCERSAAGFTLPIVARASFPYQGARFRPEPPTGDSDDGRTRLDEARR